MRAIPADGWFTGNMNTPSDWFYTGPGEGAWVLIDTQSNRTSSDTGTGNIVARGNENWFWVATLNPIPKEMTYQGDNFRMLHD